MKIVMLCDAYFDGLNYQENLLNKYYKKNGHDVTIIASAGYQNIFDYYADKIDASFSFSDEVINNTRVLKLPFKYNLKNKVKKLKGVKKYLDEERPDLIFVHSIHPNILDAIDYKKENKDTRIIMDAHMDYSNSGKNWISINVLHKIIRKYFLNKAKKHIDKIFYIVPATGKFLNEVYGIPMEEMSLLPLGIDIELSDETIRNMSGLQIREKYGIPKGAKVIFSGGKMSKSKNTHLIVEALNEINNPDFHLILVGSFGSDEKEYEQYVLEISKDRPNIHFAGWVNGNEVYHYMNAADIAVFPSSQSVLWQQCMSMGLPLIIGEEFRNETGRSFIHDVDYLNRKNNIQIIRKGNLSKDSIAERIQFLLSNPELPEMQKAAKDVAREFLDYHKIVNQTIDF